MSPVAERIAPVPFVEEIGVQVASDGPVEKRHKGRLFKLFEEQFALDSQAEGAVAVEVLVAGIEGAGHLLDLREACGVVGGYGHLKPEILCQANVVVGRVESVGPYDGDSALLAVFALELAARLQ